MEEQDLRDIGISDPQHRRKLLQAARSLPKVTSHSSAALAFARARATSLEPRTGKELGSGRADHSGVSALVLGVPENQPSTRDSENLVWPQEGLQPLPSVGAWWPQAWPLEPLWAPS